MTLTALEFSTDRAEDFLDFDPSEQDLARISPPLSRYESPYVGWNGKYRASRPSVLSRPLRHRLAVSGPNHASLEVPLQVDESRDPDFWVQTPEDVEGFELRLFIDDVTKEANLRVSIEYVGLPVKLALHYARFLYALHSAKGKLTFTMLEPRRQKIDVAELPLFEDDSTKAKLEVTLKYLEDLVAISEATGAELIYPSQLDTEDVRDARRVAEIVRTGWVTERVEVLRLTPTLEGVRNLPLEEEGPVAMIAVQSERTDVRLLEVDLHLGPSVHWIERVRLETPLARIQEWLSSGPGPDDHIDVRFVPVDGSPMHMFFPDWPKPSLERVRRDLRAFEEKYGMKSDKFAPAWRKGKQGVQHVQNGDIWMSLIGARKELERG
jgi:hypothetical protein